MARIDVPIDELTSTLTIKLRLMPKGIWRELRKQEEIDASKRGAETRYDPYKALAEYLAEEFQKSGHLVTRRAGPMDRKGLEANGRESSSEGSI